MMVMTKIKMANRSFPDVHARAVRMVFEHQGSYDNALAKTISGLYKTELVHCQGPWRNMQDLEMAMLGWVDWFNKRRLLRPIENIPPDEAEENFYAQRSLIDMVA